MILFILTRILSCPLSALNQNFQKKASLHCLAVVHAVRVYRLAPDSVGQSESLVILLEGSHKISCFLFHDCQMNLTGHCSSHSYFLGFTALGIYFTVLWHGLIKHLQSFSSWTFNSQLLLVSANRCSKAIQVGGLYPWFWQACWHFVSLLPKPCYITFGNLSYLFLCSVYNIQVR